MTIDSCILENYPKSNKNCRLPNTGDSTTCESNNLDSISFLQKLYNYFSGETYNSTISTDKCDFVIDNTLVPNGVSGDGRTYYFASENYNSSNRLIQIRVSATMPDPSSDSSFWSKWKPVTKTHQYFIDNSNIPVNNNNRYMYTLNRGINICYPKCGENRDQHFLTSIGTGIKHTKEIAKTKQSLDDTYKTNIKHNSDSLLRLNHHLSIITSKVKTAQENYKVKNKIVMILMITIIGIVVLSIIGTIVYSYVYKKQIVGLVNMTNTMNNMLNNTANSISNVLNKNNNNNNSLI
jgi:hypothetical protein